jgi:hypothetical protein
MKIRYIYIFILFHISCKETEIKESHCDKIRKDFIKDVSNIDMDCLNGFSISSRGELDNGDKYIRGTFLTYGTKDANGDIVLPSFQITNEIKSYNLDTLLSLRFVKALGLDTANHLTYTRNRIDCVRETFLKLHIFAIMSQARLGDFIEFEIEKNCSIWYKVEGAYLNDVYTKKFANAVELKKNWYILPIDAFTSELDSIPDFLIENGDTIFLEYPKGFKGLHKKTNI